MTLPTDKVLALAEQADLIYIANDGGAYAYWGEDVNLTDYFEKFAALLQQQMVADGWMQCAVGQGTTQFCGIAEELRKDAGLLVFNLTQQLIDLKKTNQFKERK